MADIVGQNVWGTVSLAWCPVTLFLGDINKCLLTPENELTTDQSRDTINIQLGQPVSLMGVTYRNRGDSKTAASPDPLPPQHECKLTEAGSLKLTAPSADSSTCWSVSFPGGSVILSLLSL